MPVDFVARALSEMLKIFGALGIVNVFTLSMLYRSNITLEGTDSSTGSISLTGYMENVSRGLDNPSITEILCGTSLILVFIRFFYGFMILLDGDYIHCSNKKHINAFDFVLIMFLLPLFAIMSVYAGTGDVEWYVNIFIFLLLIDFIGIAVTVFQERAEHFDSVFDNERKSWARLNLLTVALLVAALWFSRPLSKIGIDFPLLLHIILLITCFISAYEIYENRSFYLRGETKQKAGGTSNDTSKQS